MSYHRHIYHIVTRTRQSRKSIPEDNAIKRTLFTYILRICQDNSWHLHRINTHLDHMHILIELPGTVLPDTAMSKIKANTSRTFRLSQLMPEFDGWARGYASFTVSHYEVSHIANYIASQARHHHTKTFEEELDEIFTSHGLSTTDLDFFIKD